MCFSHQPQGPRPNVQVNRKCLDVVNQFKYHGVFLDSHLTFKQHIKITIVIKLANFHLVRPFVTFQVNETYASSIKTKILSDVQ